MGKVHIVGAGPAGSISAISALRNGHEVIVSEEHPSAGTPENCSGLLSKDGLHSLKDFIDYRKCVINPIRGADIYFMDEKMSIRRSESVGFVCSRSEFDQILVEKMESEGARINFGEKINSKFHSDDIIGADGPLSAVARHFSFSGIRKYAATLRAVVDLKSEDPHMVEVFLSKARFPGFFGWVIPHDEHRAEIGVGVSVPNNVLNAWNHLLEMKGLESRPKPKGALIPLEVRSKTAMKAGNKKIMLVGDAAGQVKATTGGGVIFGGNCAALAGCCIGNPLKYEMEWRLKFGADLLSHKFVHEYVSSLPDSGISALGRRLKNLNCDEYLSHHGHMDRPTKMLRPQMVTHFLKNITGVA